MIVFDAKYSEINYTHLGKRVREARQRLGMTQEILAERVGVSCSFIGHIERAEKIPSVETLARLGKALEVSLDYLVLGQQSLCAREKCALYENLVQLMQG